MFNKTFEVDLDDDLRIVRRTLDGDTLHVGQLSTGAVEQLGVISRLACAAIVSPDGGGAPVVIDDALGWSDPDRPSACGPSQRRAGWRKSMKRLFGDSGAVDRLARENLHRERGDGRVLQAQQAVTGASAATEAALVSRPSAFFGRRSTLQPRRR